MELANHRYVWLGSLFGIDTSFDAKIFSAAAQMTKIKAFWKFTSFEGAFSDALLLMLSHCSKI